MLINSEYDLFLAIVVVIAIVIVSPAFMTLKKRS